MADNLDLVDRCGCKVGRNIDKYGLSTLNEEMVERRETQDASLRDLEDWMNSQLVKCALDRIDEPFVGDPETVYRLLTSDETEVERQIEILDLMHESEVDVDAIEQDFVSYQTVRTHLRECLNVSTDRQGVETVEEGLEVIEWIRGYGNNVVERTLSRLARQDRLRAGTLDIAISITVACDDCGHISDLQSFIQQRGCECGEAN